jgi:hypothetical protein
MAKLDKDIVLKMMRSGDTDSKIASLFGTSRQAVNLLRKSFVREGSMRVSGSQKRVASMTPSEYGRTSRATGAPPSNQPGAGPVRPTFEELTGWMIRIIEDAGEVRDLRQQHSSAQARIERLEAESKDLRERLYRAEEEAARLLRNASQYEAAVRRIMPSNDAPPVPPSADPSPARSDDVG